MPVEDHPVHEKTILKDGEKYGCFNRPRFRPFYTMVVTEYQNFGGLAGLRPVVKKVAFRNSYDCQYDLSHNDPRCEDCVHLRR